MDFDAQGVYADLDGVIHFLRLLEGIWLKVEIVNCDPNSGTVLD